MNEKILELIKRNKQRLERYNSQLKNAKNEYNEALIQGMIDELELSIYDLEELLEN